MPATRACDSQAISHSNRGRIQLRIRDKASFLAGAVAGLLLVQLSACKTIDRAEFPNRGAVEARTIESSAADTYPTATPGEEYDGALPFDELALPAYPENLLAQRWPPVAVRVRVVVDESGDVTDVTLLNASERAQLFFPATAAALRTWTFVPLVKSERGAGPTQIVYHGFLTTYEGKATALPFHRDYEITFSQIGGKATVTSARE